MLLAPCCLLAQYELTRPPMRREDPQASPVAERRRPSPDPTTQPARAGIIGSDGPPSPDPSVSTSTPPAARIDRLEAATSTSAGTGEAAGALAWVTLAPQGASVLKATLGSRVRGIAIVECEVCSLSDNPVAVPAARIYQFAIARKMKSISGLLVNATLTASSNQNWRKGVLDALKLLSGSGSILTASGMVTAPKTWTVGLISAAQLFELLSTALKERIPDTGVVQKHILTGTLLLQPRECHSSLMLVQYRKDLESVEGELK